MTRPMPPRAPHRGFTLVELLVAITLLAIVLGAVVTLAVAQQRTYAALEARRSARVQLRDAALLLAHELRPLTGAGVDADLRSAADTLLDLVATTGGSVACAIPSPTTIELPLTEPAEHALTWWGSPPRPGDLALLHDQGAAADETDDRWLPVSIAAITTAASACAGSPLAGETSGGYRLTLGAPLPATVTRGAFVTLARRRRWSHYKAGDGLWYLGVRDWDGASWGETQPAAGPLRRSGGSAPGMAVSLVDSTGVSLTLRVDPPVAWTAAHWPVVPESARVTVGMRGAARGTP